MNLSIRALKSGRINVYKSSGGVNNVMDEKNQQRLGKPKILGKNV